MQNNLPIKLPIQTRSVKPAPLPPVETKEAREKRWANERTQRKKLFEENKEYIRFLSDELKRFRINGMGLTAIRVKFDTDKWPYELSAAEWDALS